MQMTLTMAEDSLVVKERLPLTNPVLFLQLYAFNEIFTRFSLAKKPYS